MQLILSPPQSKREDQLLGTVVQVEEPQLEEEKSKLVVQVAGCKKQLADLEAEILNLLRDGNLLLFARGIKITAPTP